MSDPVDAIAAVSLVQAATASSPAHSLQQAPQLSEVSIPEFGNGDLRGTVASLGKFTDRIFGQSTDGPAAMLARVERAALESITPQDYLRATIVATDLSMYVSVSMLKFHVSSSLGSAATGLFNTLLKNRE